MASDLVAEVTVAKILPEVYNTESDEAPPGAESESSIYTIHQDERWRYKPVLLDIESIWWQRDPSEETTAIVVPVWTQVTMPEDLETADDRATMFDGSGSGPAPGTRGIIVVTKTRLERGQDYYAPWERAVAHVCDNLPQERAIRCLGGQVFNWYRIDGDDVYSPSERRSLPRSEFDAEMAGYYEDLMATLGRVE